MYRAFSPISSTGKQIDICGEFIMLDVCFNSDSCEADTNADYTLLMFQQRNCDENLLWFIAANAELAVKQANGETACAVNPDAMNLMINN